MTRSHFKAGKFSIIVIFLLSLSSAFAADDPVKSMRMRHSDIGKLMDKLYYDAGTKADIAVFDLRELKRQGNENVDPLIKEIEAESCEMRRKWIELDNRRAAIFADILSTPLSGKHMLTIRVVDDKQGYLQISWAKLKWSNGTELKLNPEDFRTGAIDSNNKILMVQSKMSLLNSASAGFDIPASLPSEDVKLTICAIGYPGTVQESRICVSVDGNIVFEGDSPFHGRGSKPLMELKVPMKDFKEGVSAKIWADMPSDFAQLEKDINAFGKWSASVAEKIDKQTADVRKGLVYKPADYEKDWWKRHFIRGICFQSDTLNHMARGSEFEPWNYDNYEYVAKAFHDAGINLVYSYCYFESQDKILDELDKLGIPYLQCAWDHFPPSGVRQGVEEGKWSKPTFALDHYNGDYGHKGKWALSAIKYFGYPEQRSQDAITFTEKYNSGKANFRGIAIDEPVIADDGDNTRGRKYPAVSNVASYDSVIRAFEKYLSSRKPYLENNGVSVPPESKPITAVKSKSDLPLWMEWQIFKKEYMGDTYKELSDALLKNKYITLPVIMAHSFNNPQKCSYVSMASRLPMIATDLYANGSMSEAMGMQLLHNAAVGQAYMVSGAGYSCKTPANFRRSMAISMIHSDGNIQWIYNNASKYRDPFSFRKDGAKNNFTSDDRGRHSIENWKPQYWDIQVEMLGKMKKADKWLHEAESVANLAILVSERLGIAMTAGGEFFPNFPKRGYEAGALYPWMLRRNRPLDICFIETATAQDLAKYNVILLHDERIMTSDEIKRITDWVEAGGTLIATGETSLYDEWARLQKDFAMGKLFGVHYTDTRKGGAKNFTMAKGGKSVTYDANRAYVKVEPDKKAEVLATWNTGDPAVIAHKSGKGTVYYLSLKSVQWTTGELTEVDTFIRDLVNEHVQKDPVSILNAPTELEVQIRKKGESYVVHLLDWFDGERVLDNVGLKLDLPGRWEIEDLFRPQEKLISQDGKTIPLPPFQQYSMILLTPCGKGENKGNNQER